MIREVRGLSENRVADDVFPVVKEEKHNHGTQSIENPLKFSAFCTKQSIWRFHLQCYYPRKEFGVPIAQIQRRKSRLGFRFLERETKPESGN